MKSAPLNSSPATPINPSVLLEIFGQPPIIFHRCYVELAGSIVGALWLSHAVYHIAEQHADDKGWFAKSIEEWTRETGLSRREQQTARKQLVAAGLMEERQPGLQKALEYRVNTELLLQRLEAQAHTCLFGANVSFEPPSSAASFVG
jgi:hypothetical protein